MVLLFYLSHTKEPSEKAEELYLLSWLNSIQQLSTMQMLTHSHFPTVGQGGESEKEKKPSWIKLRRV